VLPLFPQVPAVFIDMDGKKSKELSRFRSSEDLDYKKIVEKMQSSLVFKSCTSESFTKYLRHSVTYKFPLDSVEHRGRTPLHWAASAPNPEASEILIKERRALVNVKANDKQTPLHRAVKWAAKVKASEKEIRTKFLSIVKKLVENSLRVDAMDQAKNTAWDYADGSDQKWNEALRKLKDMIRLIPGPSKAGKERSDVLSTPKDEQTKALKAFKALLVEVFLGDDKDDFLDFLSPVEPPVYDLIYSEQGELDKILSTLRPESVSDRKAKCRWIHIPANNVRLSIIPALFKFTDEETGTMGPSKLI